MKFIKYHALGNDYLILDPVDIDRVPNQNLIRLICHRNFGIGSDGILLGPIVTDKADFQLRIFNPDGSEAEKSGNGLRIFSRYLYDNNKVSDQKFSVLTLGGVVQCQVKDYGKTVTVEMGKISFNNEDIPVIGADREVLNETIEINEKIYNFYAATIGNPHCVIPLDEVTSSLCNEIGPIIENHKNFPNRINLQLLKIIDRNNIQIEIWERGAGYTLASGSSSCAAAAVAYKMGSVDSKIKVHMRGGTIDIDIGSNGIITMHGAVTKVGTFYSDNELFEFNAF